MCAWLYTQQQQPIKRTKSVLIGVPYKQNFSAKFLIGSHEAKLPDNTIKHMMFQTGQPLDVSRNIMVSTVLQRNIDYLLFLDQDCIMKGDTILDLFEAKQPIVSAVYFNRAPPYEVVANINSKPLTRDEVMAKLNSSPNKKALMEVHEVGMGCTLIDARVFKRMARVHNMEWYCMLRHPEQLANIETDDTGISYTNQEAEQLNYRCKYDGNTLTAKFFEYRIGKYTEDALSEDYYFCKNARRCGFQVYLSLNTIVDHELSTFLINEQGLHNTTIAAGVVV